MGKPIRYDIRTVLAATVWVIIIVVLGGCANPVVLQNPETKEMAQCDSNSWAWGVIGQKVANNKCAEGYEAAGFRRMN